MNKEGECDSVKGIGKLTENLFLLEEIKRDLIKTGSHRIRTLLNIEVGFLDALKDECKNKKADEYLKIMERVGQDIIKTIEFILNIYNIDRDILINEKKNFDPFVEFDVSSYFKEKNVTMYFDRSVRPARGDVYKIKYMLLSLVSAALKMGKRSDVAVSMEMRNGNLICNISCTAEGEISETVLRYIVAKDKENFDTLDIRTKGVVLNLGLAEKLSKVLGGDFIFEKVSEYNLVMGFSVPVDELKDAMRREGISLKGRNILIAEDNKANQMMMGILFKKAGINFDLADNGEEAIDLFKKNRYDVILMDVSMPVMDGLEATRKLRRYEREKGLGHTPVIALTANAMRGDRERFLDAGMDEYITKPVDKKKLFSIIEKLIAKNL